MKAKDIAPEIVTALHNRVTFRGPIGCSRCGNTATLDTTLLRHEIQCHVCGEPQSLTVTRDVSGFVIEAPSPIQLNARKVLEKLLESTESMLSKGLGESIVYGDR